MSKVEIPSSEVVGEFQDASGPCNGLDNGTRDRNLGLELPISHTNVSCSESSPSQSSLVTSMANEGRLRELNVPRPRVSNILADQVPNYTCVVASTAGLSSYSTTQMMYTTSNFSRSIAGSYISGTTVDPRQSFYNGLSGSSGQGASNNDDFGSQQCFQSANTGTLPGIGVFCGNNSTAFLADNQRSMHHKILQCSSKGLQGTVPKRVASGSNVMYQQSSNPLSAELNVLPSSGHFLMPSASQNSIIPHVALHQNGTDLGSHTNPHMVVNSSMSSNPQQTDVSRQAVSYRNGLSYQQTLPSIQSQRSNHHPSGFHSSSPPFLTNENQSTSTALYIKHLSEKLRYQAADRNEIDIWIASLNSTSHLTTACNGFEHSSPPEHRAPVQQTSNSQSYDQSTFAGPKTGTSSILKVQESAQMSSTAVNGAATDLQRSSDMGVQPQIVQTSQALPVMVDFPVPESILLGQPIDHCMVNDAAMVNSLKEHPVGLVYGCKPAKSQRKTKSDSVTFTKQTGGAKKRNTCETAVKPKRQRNSDHNHIKRQKKMIRVWKSSNATTSPSLQMSAREESEAKAVDDHQRKEIERVSFIVDRQLKEIGELLSLALSTNTADHEYVGDDPMIHRLQEEHLKYGIIKESVTTDTCWNNDTELMQLLRKNEIYIHIYGSQVWARNIISQCISSSTPDRDLKEAMSHLKPYIPALQCIGKVTKSGIVQAKTENEILDDNTSYESVLGTLEYQRKILRDVRFNVSTTSDAVILDGMKNVTEEIFQKANELASILDQGKREIDSVGAQEREGNTLDRLKPSDRNTEPGLILVKVHKSEKFEVSTSDTSASLNSSGNLHGMKSPERVIQNIPVLKAQENLKFKENLNLKPESPDVAGNIERLDNFTDKLPQIVHNSGESKFSEGQILPTKILHNLTCRNAQGFEASATKENDHFYFQDLPCVQNSVSNYEDVVHDLSIASKREGITSVEPEKNNCIQDCAKIESSRTNETTDIFVQSIEVPSLAEAKHLDHSALNFGVLDLSKKTFEASKLFNNEKPESNRLFSMYSVIVQ